MIDCPNCHQPVEVTDKHYGTLFTCPHCNAVYFIDWNGQPEVAQHEAEPEAPAADYAESNYSTDNFSQDQNFESPAQQADYGYQQPENATVDNSYYQNTDGGEYNSENNYQPQESSYQQETTPPEASDYAAPVSYENSEEPVAQDAYSSTEPTEPEATPYDFSQPLGRVESASASTPDTADFSDVANFANADMNAGPIVYTVFIEGIESSQILNQLRDAMTDSRFAWDVSTLLNQVGGGRLTLSGLSPAKASVLINRIKYMPVKISWRQDVFAGS